MTTFFISVEAIIFVTVMELLISNGMSIAEPYQYLWVLILVEFSELKKSANFELVVYYLVFLFTFIIGMMDNSILGVPKLELLCFVKSS